MRSGAPVSSERLKKLCRAAEPPTARVGVGPASVRGASSRSPATAGTVERGRAREGCALPPAEPRGSSLEVSDESQRKRSQRLPSDRAAILHLGKLISSLSTATNSKDAARAEGFCR